MYGYNLLHLFVHGVSTYVLSRLLLMEAQQAFHLGVSEKDHPQVVTGEVGGLLDTGYYLHKIIVCRNAG